MLPFIYTTQDDRRAPRRESEIEYFTRLSREHARNRRQARRQELIRRITGRRPPRTRG